MSDLDGLKEWKCPRGHVLGLIKRAKTTINAHDYHVTRLLLFRQAVDRDAAIPESVDVCAVIEGTTHDIRCSVCGDVRSWFIGEDALQTLIGKVRRNSVSVTG